jgi:hypothetical protein
MFMQMYLIQPDWAVLNLIIVESNLISVNLINSQSYQDIIG